MSTYIVNRDGNSVKVCHVKRSSVKEDIAMIRALGWDIYTAVEKFADGDGYNHCRCEDCATCETPCGEKNGHTACEIH